MKQYIVTGQVWRQDNHMSHPQVWTRVVEAPTLESASTLFREEVIKEGQYRHSESVYVEDVQGLEAAIWERYIYINE